MKLLKTTIHIAVLAISISVLNAQARPEFYRSYPAEYENSIIKKGFGSIGLGIGLPYGGIGSRIGYNVADKLNVFGGFGYNFLEFNFNLGLQYDLFQSGRTSFYLSGMAGANAVIIVQGLDEYNETFYGPSLGLGLKLDAKRTPGNFWQFGLVLPIRSSSFDEMIEQMKKDPRIESLIEPLPILLTIGYNMGF